MRRAESKGKTPKGICTAAAPKAWHSEMKTKGSVQFGTPDSEPAAFLAVSKQYVTTPMDERAPPLIVTALVVRTALWGMPYFNLPAGARQEKIGGILPLRLVSGRVAQVSRWRLKTDFSERYLLAILAGLLLALAFPTVSIAGMAWFAPGLLLFASAGCSGRTAWRSGYLGGFAFYLGTLHWLLHIPVPFLPIFGWIALSAYLALYPATWCWLSWNLYPASLPQSKQPWAGAVLEGLFAPSWTARALWGLKCAAFWVALEMVLGRFLTGFPWEFLGVSQYKMLPLIQVASITGIYGVSFLIVWFAVSLMLAGIALVRAPGQRGNWAREIALPMLAVAVAAALGFRAMRPGPPGETVKVALVQPSIPQTLIWDESENANRFAQLMKLSKRALAEAPQIMIWPEASVPNMLRHHGATGDAIVELVRQHDVWAVLGSDDAEYRPGTLQREIDYFNSAFAISPEGQLEGRYIKRQLVIFGEYIPFGGWMFPFLKKLLPAVEAGFTPGKEPAPFHLGDLGVTTSVLICFEDTFPHLVREYVHRDTDFLINLTNNGWFGESAAQWQHAAAAVFRAVENRVPLVRCANNGLTCWVDPTGAMHEVYFPGSDDVYRAGYKIANVPVLPQGRERNLAFYTRHGDVFGWSCLAFACASLALSRLRRKGAHGKALTLST